MRVVLSALKLIFAVSISGILFSSTAVATDRAPYAFHGGVPETSTRAYRLEVAPPGQVPVHLYAEESGHGWPLLILHGLGASGYEFRRIARSLAMNHRVITLDLRGFGRSDKPFDQAYGVLDQAAYVAAFIKRRGLHDVTLAGHSFGGAVALAVTLDLNRTRPGLISRLILMNSPAFPQPLSLAAHLLRTPVAPYVFLNLVPPQITAQLSLSNDAGNFGHITETDILSYAAPLRDPGAAHALIATARNVVPANVADLVRRYPTIKQPTLLVWCRTDPVVPLATGIALQRMLPNARLRIIEGCKHVPPEETPGELLAHMRRFLAR
jgi:pimeloyl-ACP methyl ester carboxylesterase